MTRALLRAALLAAILSLAPYAPAQDSTAGIEGTWLGALSLGATKLRIVFHIEEKDDGTYTAKLDSPAISNNPRSRRPSGNGNRITKHTPKFKYAILENVSVIAGSDIWGDEAMVRRMRAAAKK